MYVAFASLVNCEVLTLPTPVTYVKDALLGDLTLRRSQTK